MKSTKDSGEACSQLSSPKLGIPISKVMHENVKAKAGEVVPNILEKKVQVSTVSTKPFGRLQHHETRCQHFSQKSAVKQKGYEKGDQAIKFNAEAFSVTAGMGISPAVLNGLRKKLPEKRIR